jgi:adenine deaminase
MKTTRPDEKAALKRLIDVAAGREPADLLIRGAHVADVFAGRFIQADVAVCGGVIAGIGPYEGVQTVDASGKFLLPGFIDSHIHIESSFLCPEELGRLLLPLGTTAIIADPHEIVNVCGLAGLEYMINAAGQTALDIRFMLPSCVPATAWEHSGAVLNAADLEAPLRDSPVLGLGEFMLFPGVINADDGCLDKLLLARRYGKLIDGHSPGVSGSALNAYAAPLIHTDHECATAEELQERVSRGMYVQLRQGSACRDLANLLKGVTPQNSRRCVLCTDDCQPQTLLTEGHINNLLRICVAGGLDPITAIQMATLNAAECYRLHDRGGIAPGLRADLTLVSDVRDFRVEQVFIAGVLAAKDGAYLPPVHRYDDRAVRGSFHVKDFCAAKLRLPLPSDTAYVIGVSPGTVVTAKETAVVCRDGNGDFAYDGASGIAKIVVVERHQNTGNVAAALIRGYGISRGAIAISIAHDSHNIIAAGMSDADMALAIQKLLEMGGGITLVKDGSVLESLPLPLGGLMSDQSGERVAQRLQAIHRAAHHDLGVAPGVEPVLTLAFMSLAVIPELKLTDMGLFDVGKFAFIKRGQ